VNPNGYQFLWRCKLCKITVWREAWPQKCPSCKKEKAMEDKPLDSKKDEKKLDKCNKFDILYIETIRKDF